MKGVSAPPSSHLCEFIWISLSYFGPIGALVNHTNLFGLYAYRLSPFGFLVLTYSHYFMSFEFMVVDELAVVFYGKVMLQLCLWLGLRLGCDNKVA